jgi:hypothetical protein
LSEEFGASQSATEAEQQNCKAVDDQCGFPSDNVKRVTVRRPIGFEQWVEQNVEAFR